MHDITLQHIPTHPCPFFPTDTLKSYSLPVNRREFQIVKSVFEVFFRQGEPNSTTFLAYVMEMCIMYNYGQVTRKWYQIRMLSFPCVCVVMSPWYEQLISFMVKVYLYSSVVSNRPILNNQNMHTQPFSEQCCTE